jgi:ribosomal subunit interface protein
MQVPLQITFRHMEPSDAVESRIRAEADKLEQFCENIMSCRVVIESPHEHHHQGKLFHVAIDLKVPGKEIVVTRGHGKDHAHEDVYVTIRDAFNEMQRQLQDHARKQRGKVKEHEVPPHGRVTQLVPNEDYGRIETADGRDIYFHRNSVLNNAYDSLEIGSEVRFAEEMGEQGPQASSVQLVGKHHVVG